MTNYDIRDYQKSLAYMIKTRIDEGNKGLLIEMPTGFGRLRTIFYTINRYFDGKTILYISESENKNSTFTQQAKNFLEDNIRYTSISKDRIFQPHNNNKILNINKFDLIVLDISNTSYLNNGIYNLIEDYKGIIITLINNVNNDSISVFGEPVFSLKVADKVYDLITEIELDIVTIENDTDIVTPQQQKFWDRIMLKISKRLQIDPMFKPTLCINFCDKYKRKTFLTSEEVITQVIPFVLGTQLFGPIEGLITKYSIRKFIHWFKTKIPKIVNCIECLNPVDNK
ncbi:DEAD/DEAH box helicase family protein [Mesobacillus foraminis]|uniref:DEAD/DEAH box helicase family protein n=1 Tax=Mesobacillus foraminis TaxID=279826 RepID=UPI000EF47D59|nr:DEAD/DEAH box helicase family protein [Mesobacillus foraminis]